jgi:hypothetical protein
MKAWLLLLLVFFLFSPINAAELGTTLTHIETHPSNNFVHSNPIVTMEIKNDGNGTAVIKAVNFSTTTNYRITSSPGTVGPGMIGIFMFEFREMACSDLDSLFEYNISVRYAVNSTDDSFVNSSGSFQVSSPLWVESSEDTLSMYVGQVKDVPLLIKNNGTEDVSYNVTMDPGFYTQLLRYGDVYTVDELSGTVFTLSYIDVLTLRFFAVEVLEKNFYVRIYDTLCPNIYFQKEFFAKTYTRTGGLIDVAVSPDFDIYSLTLLLLLSILLMAKTFKMH